jgi:hypothetical protein
MLRCPVSSAISRIVIKSDHTFRRIPTPGQVVGVVGRSGLFVVMNIDQEDRVVQVMEKAGRHRLVNVPLSAIRTFNRSLAQAIRRFLDEHAEPRDGG